MNSSIQFQGDDVFSNRLLSYLKGQFLFRIYEFREIKTGVYLLKSKKYTFVLKAFPSYHRLKLQETFTSSLKKEGFRNTYHFYQIASDPPLIFERKFYGCLEYIKPSENVFTYHENEDRIKGLEVLNQYHEVTGKLVDRYQRLLNHYNILEKWQERNVRFLSNLSLVKFFIEGEVLDEVRKWAFWALQGMNLESDYFNNDKIVILHGDVAHHNFLRTEGNDLCLIDYDLIQSGPISADYIQYCNRILPYLDWSFDELCKLDLLRPFLKQKGFLYALLFPTDIFREWNRLIRERQYMIPVKVRQVIDLTIGQFRQRSKFVQEILFFLQKNWT